MKKQNIVIIRNFEMPKGCYLCELHDCVEGYCLASYSKINVAYYLNNRLSQRHPDCPLLEVVDDN